MQTAKDVLDNRIGDMLLASATRQTIARRLHLYDFSHVFSNEYDRGFSILNAVSEHYGVPFSAVKIVGSGQLGYSYFKKRAFTPGESDLDLAIVSSTLFQHCSELVFATTKRYKDLTNFPRRNGTSTATAFRENLSSGYFRPDLMPNSEYKTGWFAFFNKLSNKHNDLFKNINAGVYLSESFLEMWHTVVVDVSGEVRR